MKIMNAVLRGASIFPSVLPHTIGRFGFRKSERRCAISLLRYFRILVPQLASLEVVRINDAYRKRRRALSDGVQVRNFETADPGRARGAKAVFLTPAGIGLFGFSVSGTIGAGQVPFQLPKTMISVNQAAEIIGVTVSRIRQMLRGGELKGVKLTERAWVIDERSARKAAKNPHSVGRPRSAKKIA